MTIRPFYSPTQSSLICLYFVCLLFQSLAEARSISPIPEELAIARNFRESNASSLYFYVTGSDSGNLWGSGIYTDDSSIAKAAVHAGLLKIGQSGVVKLNFLPGQSSYQASTANGVSSASYGSFSNSFSLSADDGGNNPVLPEPGNLNSWTKQAGEAYLFSITAKTGGSVWGTNVYTSDTDLRAAAIHAGILREGEQGVVRVVSAPGQSQYYSSQHHGVTSNSYGSWGSSYTVSNSVGNTPLLPFPGSFQSPLIGLNNASGYDNSIGGAFYVQVTGTDTGSVWGDNPYTSDSLIAKAAVHAGLVKVGASAIVKITILPGQSAYSASTANGISTSSYGAWRLSYRLSLADGGLGQTPLITSASNTGYTPGSTFKYQIMATNGATTFSASGLPKGLSLNSESGLISGVPLLSGRFLVDLHAANQSGYSSKTLDLVSNIANVAGTQISSGSFIEPNNTPEQATPILVNDRATHQLLDNPGDIDWFEFYAKAGENYTVEIAESSIGQGIKPFISLLDHSGNLLTSQNGSAHQLIWSAQSGGLFRIRVQNQISAAPKALTPDDESYQIRLFLTDSPQSGLIKGTIGEICNGQSLGDVEVTALAGEIVADSTFSHKTGEYGIVLNPADYQVKSFHENFFDQTLPANVKADEINITNLQLVSRQACASAANPDLTALAQQAPAVYNQGLLIVRDAIVEDQVFYAELQDQGGLRFKISKAFLIPGAIHERAVQYNPATRIAVFAEVFALNKLWNAELTFDGVDSFVLTRAIPIN